MAFYKGTIYKHMIPDPTEVWSNVYNLEAANESEALDILEAVMIIEQTVHKDYVVFDKLAVRQDSVLSGSGQQRAVSGVVGAVTGTPSLRLPLFNVARAIFSDAVNRPDQKYLRLPLEEGDTAGGFLESTLIALLNADYCEALKETAGVVSSSHVPYTGSSVQDAVQMRQISWSRRTRPGFKRGWVPV